MPFLFEAIGVSHVFITYYLLLLPTMPRTRKSTKKAASDADKDKPPELQWTEAMEAALFNAFLEQQNCGKRADLGWKSEAWGPVIAAVQAIYEGPVVITKTHCQTKEGVYKSHYKDHI
jgi:hypothetical protein